MTTHRLEFWSTMLRLITILAGLLAIIIGCYTCSQRQVIEHRLERYELTIDE